MHRLLALIFAAALLQAQPYSMTLDPTGPVPSFLISSEGRNVFRLPAVSGLSSGAQEEKLTNVQFSSFHIPAVVTYHITADSSLWSQRHFTWKFYVDHIEFQQFATGDKPLERCYFFSNGISERWANGSSPGVTANTTVFADRYFSPRVNHADQWEYSVAMPQSIGIAAETPEGLTYDPLGMDGLYVPPPLALMFHRGATWTSVGIGAKPGSYLFNGLEYSGSRYAGASFWVNYRDKQTAGQGFESPVAALHFGYEPFGALAEYLQWIDASRFGTDRRFPSAPWHRLPIFCGWAEQTVEALARGIEPHDLATEKDYEGWIAIQEKRGLPIGTIVIDDKWQKQYGTFDVDDAKWPDMAGFIARQHAKGRHVLLWIPAAHREGLSKELCVLRNGKPVSADASNPAYEQFLRQQIKHLVADLGVDGFKEDWIGGSANFADLEQHTPLYGIEFLRRFQYILHDETHKWRPDAMVETQTPNPLFRESSDVLRLNDIWYGARDVTTMMRRRARIAWLAGWRLVDCDNASSTDLEEWWTYMQAQPSIGIPALYFVEKTESTKEIVPDDMWHRLADIWTTYRAALHQ